MKWYAIPIKTFTRPPETITLSFSAALTGQHVHDTTMERPSETFEEGRRIYQFKTQKAAFAWQANYLNEPWKIQKG